MPPWRVAPARDVMTGGAGVNDMKGEEGKDVITGGSGPSTMFGGINTTSSSVDSNVNSLSGDDGNDTLVGGPLTDKLSRRRPAATSCSRAPAGDQIIGGHGDDMYRLDADAAGGNSHRMVETLVRRRSTSIDLSVAPSVDVALNLTNGAPQVLSPTHERQALRDRHASTPS